jgi:hypothetical protein
MPLNKRIQIFFSMAKCCGNFGRIILRRVGNTGRWANKCGQIQAYFKGEQTIALVSMCYLIHTEEAVAIINYLLRMNQKTTKIYNAAHTVNKSSIINCGKSSDIS